MLLSKAEIGTVAVAAAAGGLVWALFLRNNVADGNGIPVLPGKDSLEKEKKKGKGAGGKQQKEPVGPKIEVYFGSQTGTAEEFAKAMSMEGRDLGYDMHAVDLEKFEPDNMRGASAIFLLATYGEGDPTDNSKRMYSWLKEATGEALKGLQFAVFGLGNTQYDEYNSMGKFFDKWVPRSSLEHPCLVWPFLVRECMLSEKCVLAFITHQHFAMGRCAPCT